MEGWPSVVMIALCKIGNIKWIVTSMFHNIACTWLLIVYVWFFVPGIWLAAFLCLYLYIARTFVAENKSIDNIL